MIAHLVEGEPGCRFAVEGARTAVVVDALRASATAAMLLHHGSRGVLCVRGVDEARAARDGFPGALLYGERDGLPPAGFDHGNSPLEACHAAGRPVVFTTTTGAQRLVDCWGAPSIFMGSTVNVSSVAAAARQTGREIVVIPAGLAGDPSFDALEDWAAAVAIARALCMEIGEGKERFDALVERLDDEGVESVFRAAPHSGTLLTLGFDADISFCARLDATSAVPEARKRIGTGVWMEARHPAP